MFVVHDICRVNRAVLNAIVTSPSPCCHRSPLPLPLLPPARHPSVARKASNRRETRDGEKERVGNAPSMLAIEVRCAVKREIAGNAPVARAATQQREMHVGEKERAGGRWASHRRSVLWWRRWATSVPVGSRGLRMVSPCARKLPRVRNSPGSPGGPR